MPTRLAILAAAALCLCPIGAPPSPRAQAQTTVAPFLWQPSMNVFRRFTVEREKMVEFYGAVLGLKALPAIGLGGGNEMTRFLVGTSEIKFTAGLPSTRKYATGDLREVTGLRLLTLFFPDERALRARFSKAGYSTPEFHDVPGTSTRSSLVRDPAGEYVELVVVTPDAPAEVFDRIEVGLAVSDIEKSRSFYRDFVGLEELPPVHDVRLGRMKYPFRHGTTTVNLWSIGEGLPANTGTAGIQYVVSDAAAVDVKAKAWGATIDTPLGNTMPGLRTIWLSDPDGITNYFAETSRSRQGAGSAPTGQP